MAHPVGEGSDVTVATGLTPAQAEMVMANTGLIGFVLKRTRWLVGGVYTEQDAWQDGFFGLVRAVQKFDPSLGYRFSTYAPAQIKSAIQHGRGRAEGKRWRTAADAGELDQLEYPVSLDGLVVDGDIELGEALPSPGPSPEDEAITREVIAWLRSTACQDVLDRAVLDAMLAGESTHAAAVRLGYSHTTGSNRANRLRTLAASRLEEQAA